MKLPRPDDTRLSTALQAFAFGCMKIFLLDLFTSTVPSLRELLHFLRDNGRLLFARDHDLESVEVRQIGALLLGRKLLGPGGGLPLGGDVLLGPGGLEGLGTGVALNLDREISQGDALVGNDLTGNTGLGAIDEALVLVDDVDDGGELAAVGTVVNQDHPADLNKASETHCISN